MSNTDPSTDLLAAVAAAHSTAKILEEQLEALLAAAPEGYADRLMLHDCLLNTYPLVNRLGRMERRLTADLTPAVPAPDPRQPSTLERLLSHANEAYYATHIEKEDK